MAQIDWTQNSSFYTKGESKVSSVGRDDWIGFLDALGKIESDSTYDAINSLGYMGMYQFANYTYDTSILKTLDFYNNVGKMLNIESDLEFASNPIAQELAAIMEFSGIPDTTKDFTSKYTAVRNSAAQYDSLSHTNFDKMIGQEFTINYTKNVTDDQGNITQEIVQSVKVTFTKAGISAAAHLTGEGVVAKAMKDIYDQAFDADGNLKKEPFISLSSTGNYADGNGVAFTTYLQLLQNFDISALTDTADGANFADFSTLTEELISYRSDKIKEYMISKGQSFEMSTSLEYYGTIKAIMDGLGVSTENLNKIGGKVIIETTSTLEGSDSSDLIIGLGDTNNILKGNGGNDYLEGGKGVDTYYAESGDIIYDSDGQGHVVFEGITLSKGVWNEQLGKYVGDGGTYTLANGVLTFTKDGQTLTIKNYHHKTNELGITLTGNKNDPLADLPGTGGDQPLSGSGVFNGGSFSSPLVFDLNGDGVTSQDLYDTTTHFDMDGDGFSERTAWTQSEDGLLVLDKNANGTIDNGNELFGNNTILSNGTKAANGFEALSEYDENGDGVIDAKDNIYDDLKVWVDANSDGVSQKEELKTLSELNITSININSTSIKDTELRNKISNTSTFTQNGEQLTINDVWFATDTLQAIQTFDVNHNGITDVSELEALGDAGSIQILTCKNEINNLKGVA